MRVKLPNGRIIDNVPEGTSKDQIMQKAISSGIATQDDFGVTVPVAQTPEVAQSSSPLDQIIGQTGGLTTTGQEELQLRQQNRQEQEARALEQKAIDQETIGQKLIGAGETGLTMATGAVAEPLAGLAGIGGLAIGQSPEQAAELISNVREAGTYSPKTETGERYLEATGEALKPVGDVFRGAEQEMGDIGYAIAGPMGGAIGSAIPAAATAALGVVGRGAKAAEAATKVSPSVSKAITQAAPDFKVLKEKSSALYDELDDYGVKIKPEIYDKFTNELHSALRKEGLDKDITPKSQSAMNRIIEEQGIPKTPSDINTLRKVASNAAASIDPADKRMGTMIVEKLDDAMDKLSNEIGGKYKEARGLYRKYAKSKQINEMIEQASDQASGLENGLRIEARKILRSSKKRRGFSRSEIDSLKTLSRGTPVANVAKFLGKWGISENQATNMMGTSIGAASGGALGAMFGGAPGAMVGAAVVPALGQIAKKAAVKLTQRNARVADELIRAGDDAKEITRAYIRNTPASKRTVGDLTDLLSDPKVSKESISKISTKNKLIEDAKYYSEVIKDKLSRAEESAKIAAPALIEREDK